jgi:glycosyltransferase involved in cell wall biosynthesis
MGVGNWIYTKKMGSNRRRHIIFVGLSGYPSLSSAPIQRGLNLGLSLYKKGWDITYLNRLPAISDQKSEGYGFAHYENVIGPKKSYQNKYGRFFWKNMSFFIEVFKLIRLNRKHNIDFLFVYTQYFGVVVFYWLISRVLSIKICLSYVEYRSVIPGRNSVFLKINDYLFDRYSFAFSDSVNPISLSLEKIVNQHYPDKPQIRIPPLCNFSLFVKEPAVYQDDYFLYCGSAAYLDVVKLLLDAFVATGDNEVKLVLIISGNKSSLDKVQLYITDKDNVIVETNISYSRLINLYTNALALIIPLRNTKQDQYRFPHKISEYTASKRPIITTDIGDISYYFTDKINAIVAGDDSVESLSGSISWAIKNKRRLEEIGLNSYHTGLANFSDLAYSDKLDKFLSAI